MNFCRFTAAIFLSILLAAGAAAQSVALPEEQPQQSADELFSEGLRYYESAAFSEAYDTFARIFVEFEPNPRTTAALLMAGKALYAGEEYERSIQVLNRLLDEFPDSRYAETARDTRERARDTIERNASFAYDLFRLGVTLPQSQPAYSQPLLRGILLATELHNADNPPRPVKLVFRDSGGRTGSAGSAVSELVGQDSAEAIFGPLYSEEAVIAAAQAQRAGVVMMVPLATDGDVSDGRDLVFQANPTFDMRGREMARYAFSRLRVQRAGLVVERGTAAEAFATGFSETFTDLGGSVRLDFRLDDRRDWYQIGDLAGPDTLTFVDALYVPVTGAGSHERIRALLDGLANLAPALRVLGNGEWADLANPDPAVRHATVFTADAEQASGSSEERRFRERFVARFGSEPEPLAFTGFDITQMLLQRLDDHRTAQELAGALRDGGLYEGLARTIRFDGGNVNTSIGFWEYRSGGVVRRD